MSKNYHMDLEAERMQQITKLDNKITNLKKMNKYGDLDDKFKSINDDIIIDLITQKRDLLNLIVNERRKGYGQT